MLNYILNLATIALAAFTLAKDWKAHQNHWRRGAIIFFIVVLGGASLVNTHFSNKKAIAQQQDAIKDQKQIASLGTAVETANKAQATNTKLFVESFTAVNGQLNGLQTKIETAGLQKESDQLKAALASNIKALNPPQAQLIASLGDVTETLQNLNVKERLGQLAVDGTVSFKLHIVNSSDVQAKDGTIYLRTCLTCTYADEPTGFIKVTNGEESDRSAIFPQMGARTGAIISLRIKPPQGEHQFVVKVKLRCENCAIEPYHALYVDY
jgi:hypothetical protein